MCRLGPTYTRVGSDDARFTSPRHHRCLFGHRCANRPPRRRCGLPRRARRPPRRTNWTSCAEELGGPEKRDRRRAATSTEWADCEALVAAATDAFGGFDAVFANAGFGAARGFLEESPEQWRSMVLTNVLGVAYTIRATLPHLLEKGTGHFVITSSVAGRRALPGSLYSATKWSVTAMGEALRQELRQMHDNHAHPRDPDRARHGRHAVLRQQAGERARRTRTSRTPSCTRSASPSTST